jgi:hypothetical protein
MAKRNDLHGRNRRFSNDMGQGISFHRGDETNAILRPTPGASLGGVVGGNRCQRGEIEYRPGTSPRPQDDRRPRRRPAGNRCRFLSAGSAAACPRRRTGGEDFIPRRRFGRVKVAARGQRLAEVRLVGGLGPLGLAALEAAALGPGQALPLPAGETGLGNFPVWGTGCGLPRPSGKEARPGRGPKKGPGRIQEKIGKFG